MAVDYKQLIKEEYLKCAKDPAYFMRRYCMIQHPVRGRILFNLYPFQEKVLHLFKDSENIIVLKSRQLGISTLGAGYALWLMIFHRDKNVLCLATTQATARNLVTKVQFMYDNLPKWLQVPTTQKNKLSLRLSNGSMIQAVSSNPDSARSLAISLLLVDECAFIENIETTMAAAMPTLSTGGQVMLLSTPNGMGNYFHKTWVNAEMGLNSFVPVKLPWNVHPERDQKWRDQQEADMGKRAADQECDCDFLTSGDTFFEQEDMSFYEETYVQDPVERRGVGGEYWIWEYPDYSKSYMVSADVARGDGGDFSTAIVWNIESCTQVAEYQGQMGPKDFGAFLCTIATEYNNALLSVENANIGWATIEEVLSRDYRNLYYSSTSAQDTVESYTRKSETGRLTPGFTTSPKTRPLMLAAFYDYVHTRSVILRSKRTLLEMRTFIWSNSKAQASNGTHDDLVMASAQGLFLRDTSLKLRQQGIDLTRASLGAFGNLNRRDQSIMTSVQAFNNPYKIQNQYGQQEDIKWLL